MKQLGALSIALAWTMGYLLMRYWHVDGVTTTTSLIAASHKKAHLTFLWGLVFCGTLFGIFMWSWFIPHFQFGLLFQVVLAVSLGFQFFTGLITDTGGTKGRVHSFFAYGLGTLMFALAILVILRPSINVPVRIMSGLLASVLGTIMLSTARLTQVLVRKRSFIRRQQIFFLSFHAIILLVTYLG